MLEDDFGPSENLYRAIIPIWVKDENSVTSAAFKVTGGPSFDKENARQFEDCMSQLRQNHPSLEVVVQITCQGAMDNAALPTADPVDGNPFHVILKNSSGSVPLTDSCARKVSRAVSICFRQNRSQFGTQTVI